MKRRFAPLSLAFGTILVLGFALGCTTTSKTGRTAAEFSPNFPDSLYMQIKADYDSGYVESVEPAARQLLRYYPDFEKADDVYLMAARASQAQGEYAQTAKHATALADQFPLSPHREEALFLAAEAYAELGRYFESAEALSELLSAPVGPELESQALTALKALSQDQLGVPELDRLIADHPGSPLAGELSLNLAKREFARGNYDRAYTLLADLLYQFPEHKRSPEVRELLKLAAARRDNPDRTVNYVEPYKIGVIMPYTGNFSRFGRYFEQGVGIAVDEFNASNDIIVSFVKADSKGNPVDAVSAVRKLVLEEGTISILGGVFSVPTIAAAIECNAWRVPMLSPVVSEHRIEEIGPWIFQTRVNKEIEVSAIARVAREDLLLQRFAVLAPLSPRRRKLAEFFVREVSARGGDVVAEEYYKPGDTDFRDQLEIIRDSAPEALFIPGDPEELMLVLPQVSFYDMQLQLLGLSDWNSDKLLRLSKRELEGALFPGEAHHGKDRVAYQQFVSQYETAFNSEAHPVAVQGYFGMRLLLRAVQAGAVDRAMVKDFLTAELEGSPSQRMAAANSLLIMKVSAGKVSEFTAFAH